MYEEIQLNVSLLRSRVPNLTAVARSVGLRPATVSNLCTGKIPIGRAEVRTLVALASLAGCSLDELIVSSSRQGLIETGIKVLDLLAPLVRGGTVGFVARPRMGQFVLLAELIRRLRKKGFATVFWQPEIEDIGVQDVNGEAEVTATTFEKVSGHVASLRADRDVLVAVDRSALLSGELFALREKLAGSTGHPVTFALVDIQGEVVDEEVPYGPLDALWRFDADLVARSLYPAIDPLVSTSTLLEGALLEERHFQIQQRARKLLRRYRELRSLVSIHGLVKVPSQELVTYRRGEQLEAFFAQPFYVAEPFFQRPGEWVSLQDTLDSVKQIMDGNWNQS